MVAEVPRESGVDVRNLTLPPQSKKGGRAGSSLGLLQAGSMRHVLGPYGVSIFGPARR